jgi:hypothetical protein
VASTAGHQRRAEGEAVDGTADRNSGAGSEDFDHIEGGVIAATTPASLPSICTLNFNFFMDSERGKG